MCVFESFIKWLITKRTRVTKIIFRESTCIAQKNWIAETFSSHPAIHLHYFAKITWNKRTKWCTIFTVCKKYFSSKNWKIFREINSFVTQLCTVWKSTLSTWKIFLLKFHSKKIAIVKRTLFPHCGTVLNFFIKNVAFTKFLLNKRESIFL